MQCLAASKKDMHVDPRHAGGKQYRVPIRAKNLTTYLSGISVMVINGNRFAEVQRRAEKRSLPNPFGDLGVGASLYTDSFNKTFIQNLCICMPFYAEGSYTDSIGRFKHLVATKQITIDMTKGLITSDYINSEVN